MFTDDRQKSLVLTKHGFVNHMNGASYGVGMQVIFRRFVFG